MNESGLISGFERYGVRYGVGMGNLGFCLILLGILKLERGWIFKLVCR